MKRKIFFDLDGTLSDPRRRLYDLFTELVGDAKFSFEEYWNIKRQRTNQDVLLSRYFGYQEDQIRKFKTEWLAKVEEQKRLDFDQPFERVGELLEQLSSVNELYVVTARQRVDLALMQIEKFGWASFFKAILVTEQSKTKAELIRSICSVRETDIFVGDTGEDIQTAKELNIVSVAVCSGFLSREVLSTYQPDYLLSSVLELHETDLV